MKKHFSLLLSLFAIVLLLPQCKKEKTVEVYFTSSSATATRGGGVSVTTIEFSEPTNDVVELDLQSIGTDPLHFGSYNDVFLLDDSAKCQATIDNNAFIDTTGHLKIGYGVKKVTITFTPQFDNFPHAEANYKIKITAAKNAIVRSGSNEFSYHISEAAAVYNFSSQIAYNGLEHANKFNSDTICVDTIMQRAGYFTLGNYTYTKQANGKFHLELNYNFASGNTHVPYIQITVNDLSPFAYGINNFDCSNVSILYTPPVSCGQTGTNVVAPNLTGSFTTCNNQATGYPNTSPEYGKYITLTGNMNLGGAVNVDGANGTISLSGTLNSDFIVY